MRRHGRRARTFDAVLLDAPCTSTGTIRRHPDILRLKRSDDVAALADVQSRLLDNAARLVAPGGTLLYCTCSLEPEEGARADRALSVAQRRVCARADRRGRVWNRCRMADAPRATCARCRYHLPNERPELSGMDGFYAARLVRRD